MGSTSLAHRIINDTQCSAKVFGTIIFLYKFFIDANFITSAFLSQGKTITFPTKIVSYCFYISQKKQHIA